ncbi:MAG: bifunctional metallophosphatase/5'-nucleotidase [Faecousia sp.]
MMLVLAVFCSLPLPVQAEEPTTQATILFTHDLHSHLLPAAHKDGGEYGGYARLMTVIRQQKEAYPNAILVDGGDFSMGSLFQTVYATSAIELRMMGAMGYDATTFGNHEFDYLPQGLASMLQAAASCGEAVPAILDANYWPKADSPDRDLVLSAMETYGVKDYMLLERGGVHYAIFGLTGFDSDDCAPNSGMALEDPVAAAQRTVDQAVAECKEVYGAEPLVIALSHSGTSDGKGEDYELAKAVTGIDLIVSGHSHTTLNEPIQVGDTWIVSAGEYGRNLGVVQMSYHPDGSVALTDYDLIPVDETVMPQDDITALVEAIKEDVQSNYLSDYGVTFDQILTHNPYPFDDVDAVYDYAHESTLGNLFSDAYRWAASQALGHDVDVALTASGVIRESVPLGDVTVSDVFNAASLGVGTEGELVEVWLTGTDLKTALEVDASVYPLMHSAQLFGSGVEYSFNTNRMIFNKVDYAMLRREDGSLEEIQEDKLYCVVTGMYMAQMLGSVEKTSMGLISITPRDAAGQPLDQSKLADYVIRDETGVPVKEWFAIASYLQQMGGEMDHRYAAPDGRKVVYSSLNPVHLLKNANHFTWIGLGALAVVVLLILLTIFLVGRAIRRKRK